MNGLKRVSLIEFFERLLLPVFIFLAGTAYTIHKDHVDSARHQTEKVESDKRQALDRDSGYVKLLASNNDREVELGQRIVQALQEEGKFSKDLYPVVIGMSKGKPSDATTKAANQILAGAEAKQIIGDSAPSPQAEPTDVYVQIWQEGQRNRALQLQKALRDMGYGTPSIQLVPHPTNFSYVRYFANDRISQANEVFKLLVSRGFNSKVQSFVGSQEPKSENLEVWFGATEPVISRAEDDLR